MFSGPKVLELMKSECQLDSIRSKHNVRWQHLSQMKDEPVGKLSFTIKMQQAMSRTNAATYKLTEPHFFNECRIPRVFDKT